MSNPNLSGQNYRLLSLPAYREWSRRKLEAGESQALIAHLDATSIFLRPESLDSLSDATFDEMLEDLRSELD